VVASVVCYQCQQDRHTRQSGLQIFDCFGSSSAAAASGSEFKELFFNFKKLKRLYKIIKNYAPIVV
jgi:hypothetical protein